MKKRKMKIQLLALLTVVTLLLSQFAFAAAALAEGEGASSQTISENEQPPQTATGTESSQEQPPTSTEGGDGQSAGSGNEQSSESGDEENDASASEEESSSDAQDGEAESLPELNKPGDNMLFATNGCQVEFVYNDENLINPVIIDKNQKLGQTYFDNAEAALRLKLESNQDFSNTWEDASGAVVTAETVVIKALTITPVVTTKPVTPTYTATFYEGGPGTSEAAKISFEEGQALGDVYGESGNAAKPSPPNKPTGDPTLIWAINANKNNGDGSVAYWSALDDTEEYTYSFGVYPIWTNKVTLQPGVFDGTYATLNGSTAEVKKIVLAGDTLTLPTPICEIQATVVNGAGFQYRVPVHFTGWKDASGDSVAAPGLSPSKDTVLIGQWKAAAGGTTTVTFETGGLSGTASEGIIVKDVAIGAKISNFPSLNDNGKTLNGWTDGSKTWDVNTSGSITGGGECIVEANMVLTPVWGDNSYTVTYFVEGVKNSSQTLKYNEKATPPTIAPIEVTMQDGSKVLCPVKHWIKDSPPVEVWNFDNGVTTDLNLYAVREYPGTDGDGGDGDDGEVAKIHKVTFDEATGTGANNSYHVLDGQKVQRPTPDPKWKGHTFRFWSADKTTQFDFEETPITGDITLTALWDKDVDVVFNSDSGSRLAVVTIPYNTPVKAITDPTKLYYNFLGWSTEKQNGQKADQFDPKEFDFSQPITNELLAQTGNKDDLLVLWAWYDSNTKVVFHYKDRAGDIGYDDEETVSIQAGESLTLPYRLPDVTKVQPLEYVFSNWEDESGGTIESNHRLTRGETLHVYPSWEKGYNVAFITGPAESAGIEKPILTTIDSYKWAENKVTPIGRYDKSKNKWVAPNDWYYDTQFQQKAYFSITDPKDARCIAERARESGEKQISLYGKWSYNFGNNHCKVTYYGNGGKLGEDQKESVEVTVKAGNKLAPPSTQGQDGTIFGEWYQEPECQNRVDLDSPVVADMKLYARWVYPVEFYATAAAPRLAILYALPNDFVSMPDEEPGQALKSFLGWKEMGSDKIWDFTEDTVNSPKKLYGVWGVTVTFDARGGTPEPDKVTLRENEVLQQPQKTPVLDEEHKFLGWFEDLDTGGAFVFGAPVTKNTALYAKYQGWEDSGAYRLNMNVQTGGRLLNQVGKYHEAGDIIRLELEALPGYTFLGWSTSAGGKFGNANSLSTTYTMPAKNSSIVAQFQKIKKQESTPGSGGGGGGGGGSETPVLKSKSGLNSTLPNSARPNANAQAATYTMNQSGRVSVSTMEELIRQNATKDIVLKSNDFEFKFAQGEMQQVPGVNAYDFSASFNVGGGDSQAIAGLAGDALVLTVRYKYHGALPSKAEIRINVGEQYANQSLYYYYYNPETEALELVQQANVGADGWVTVQQSHFSDYAFLSVNLYSGAQENGTSGVAANAVAQDALRNTGVGGSVSANGPTAVKTGTQSVSATQAGRVNGLPSSGRASSMALMLCGTAALASSMCFLRKFIKALKEETDEE